jgi:hypothetical protein
MMRILGAVAVALLAGAGALSAVALEVHRDRDVYWVSGGVGADERDEMVMALPDANLKLLTAAEKSGAFLSAVEVVLRDAGGRPVLETSLDGPWLLARLPPGEYALVATYGGRREIRTFTVPATGRREIFLYWSVPGIETLPSGAAP